MTVQLLTTTECDCRHEPTRLVSTTINTAQHSTALTEAACTTDTFIRLLC